MTLKNSLKTKTSQAILEYTIVFAVVLVVLIVSGLLGKVRESFNYFFSTAHSIILGD